MIRCPNTEDAMAEHRRILRSAKARTYCGYGLLWNGASGRRSPVPFQPEDHNQCWQCETEPLAPRSNCMERAEAMQDLLDADDMAAERLIQTVVSPTPQEQGAV